MDTIESLTQVHTLSPLCDHSNKSDRVRFYRTLEAHSTVKLGHVERTGTNEPRTEEEKALMAQWNELISFKCFAIIQEGLHALLALPEKEQHTVMKANHILNVFTRTHKISNVVSFLIQNRVRTYGCECHDTRCICGEPSGLCYIYNHDTGIVLAVGTTCIKTVKMKKLDYMHCSQCNKKIQGYSTKTKGRCSDCAKTLIVGSGVHAHTPIGRVPRNYDVETDPSLALEDAINILEYRRSLERCNREGCVWNHRCSWCLLTGKVKARSGPYAGVALLELYLRDGMYESGSDLDKSDTERIGNGPYGITWYEWLSDQRIEFTKKHYDKTYAEMRREVGFLAWARQQFASGGKLGQLLDYVEIMAHLDAVRAMLTTQASSSSTTI